MKIYNTVSQQKESFTPIDPLNVRMYVCGPTVYDRAHIGNLRPAIVFDILFRLLRYEYGIEHVVYARNFTDIDDKINSKAIETKRSIKEITDETIALYHNDMRELNILSPTHEPRATEYIQEMIDLTHELIENGNAYIHGDEVLFKISSVENYGHLLNMDIKDLNVKDDFIIWKPSYEETGLPGWNTPFSNERLRPGWHSECVAMSRKLLGGHFDIHAGGIDLRLHHTNEIAQANACGHKFANYWMHNGHLMVSGEKMSKSNGKLITTEELFEQKICGNTIRLMMLLTHYRMPLEWSDTRLENARNIIEKWQKTLNNVVQNIDFELKEEFMDYLYDDMNIPGALSIKLENNELQKHLEFLGFNMKKEKDLEIDEEIQTLIDERNKARLQKNWKLSDDLRDKLIKRGLIVKDS